LPTVIKRVESITQRFAEVPGPVRDVTVLR
jgi:hypothetical protein